jgi:hypothetical protein
MIAGIKRDKPGDAMPPYAECSERKVSQRLSGHAVYMCDGVTCLFSRMRDGARRGTILYLYDRQIFILVDRHFIASIFGTLCHTQNKNLSLEARLI